MILPHTTKFVLNITCGQVTVYIFIYALTGKLSARDANCIPFIPHVYWEKVCMSVINTIRRNENNTDRV